MSSAIQAVLKTAPRRATLKKIRNLASQKPEPFKFTPSDAYVLLDHGEEGDGTFIVPENCMVVVKGRPAQLQPGQLFTKNMKPLIEATEETVEKYRDPLHYITDIIGEFGSIVIFKPGDECPNFIYQLHDNPDEEDESVISSKTSGVIKLPLPEGDRRVSDYSRQFPFPKDMTLMEYFKIIYRHSVEPTIEKAQADIMRITNQYGITLLITDLGSRYISRITQKELFQIDATGIAHRPGVFYNFVCRQTDYSPYEAYGYNVPHPNRPGEMKRVELRELNEPAMVIQNWITSVNPKVPKNQLIMLLENDPHPNSINLVKKNQKRRLEKEKMYSEMLKRGIGEAETKRKQLLRGTKYNTSSTRRTRRRRN